MSTPPQELPSDEPYRPSDRVAVARGAIGRVSTILAQLEARSLFLVADETAYHSSGAEELLRSELSTRQVERFTHFQCDPKLSDVERGIQCFRKTHVDAVLAIGGGSALDMAKLVSNLGMQQEQPEQLIRGKARLLHDGPPLIALPTTAGTGSEATHFAVCYMDGVKFSLAHRFLLPEFAILDPQLTDNLPPRLTASSGLDALCQAVESLWAVDSNEVSVQYACEAVRLAFDHLAAAVHEPTPAIRTAMCRAAHLAGQAINISKTTAAHAISYAISMQAGVPHGMAVAMTLAPVLLYNAETSATDCVDPCGAEHVRSRIGLILQLLGSSTPLEAAKKIEKLVGAVGGPTRLNEIGMDSDAEVETLVRSVNTERLSNNPRRVTPDDLRRLLESVRY